MNYTKCNDCGAEGFEPSEIRSDICPDCGQLRLDLIAGMKAGNIQLEEFKDIQRALSGRSHSGAAMMRQALGLTAPEI